MGDPDIVGRIERLEQALRAHVGHERVSVDHVHDHRHVHLHDIDDVVGLGEKVGQASPEALAEAETLRARLIERWGSDEVIGWAPPGPHVRDEYRT